VTLVKWSHSNGINQQFLALSYTKSKDIAAFNALFKDLLAKMQQAGLEPFSPTFLIHLYLRWVGHAFPTWAERQRSVLRTLSNTGVKPTAQTLDDMMADLIDENRSISAQDENGTSISLYGNRPQYQKGNSNKKLNNQQKRGQLDKHCSHCNKNGHLEQNCYIKHPEKKEEFMRQRNAKNENKSSNMHRDTKADPHVLMAHHIQGLNRSDWILDTGASHHMCNDRTMFDEYKTNTNPANTIATAGSDTRAEGYGSVTLTAIQSDNSTVTITLKDVFHMPSLEVNLLSGPTIKRKGVYIDGKTETLRYSRNDQEICRFQSLHSAMRICTVLTSQAMIAAAQSIDVWHRRLGHIGLENVRKTALITKGIQIRPKPLQQKEICKPCIISKAMRTQSKQPQLRSEHAFDKIHFDLLGPITPTAYDGSKWAMIKTDDATRARWLSTFAKKGDAKADIKDFIIAISTQYGKTPKCFRLDNGTEYGGQEFKDFCKSKGISIEPTVPYTPEQDGVAKRANRTILDRCRTLINALDEDEDHQDLKNLWPEFMRTAIYLTNRMATRSLQNKTLIEALTTDIGQPTVPDLSHLRTIGCKAYYHIPKERRQQGAKFEARAKAGILVGYEGNSIYRIYDKDRGIIRASAVVFDENDALDIKFDDLFHESPVHQSGGEEHHHHADENGKLHENAHNESENISTLSTPTTDQMIIPGGFQDDSDDQDLIDNQIHADQSTAVNQSIDDGQIPDYLSQLQKIKTRQRPVVIPTAASSRPIRNQVEDPTKKRLQAPGSLEDNY
jgi:transposase InsO family protein